MSAAIGPGDFVERDPAYSPDSPTIPVSAITFREGDFPCVGRIYRCRAVGTYREAPHGGLVDGLKLEGIVAAVPGHPDCWWRLEAFRPIYRPKQSLIEQLKQPAPDAVRELVDAD